VLKQLLKLALITGPILVAAAPIKLFYRPGPPLRLNEDACAVCAMGIWDARFAAAAEFQHPGPDGAPARGPLLALYDDMGCLLDVGDAQPSRPTRRIWVRSAAGDRWLDASRAFFVLDPATKTPMGSGIAAYPSVTAARRAHTVPVSGVLSLPELREARREWRRARGITNP